MKNKFILSIITILLLSPALSLAEQKVFTHTVRYVMGENESRQELRELATLEAKRQVLEQVGVYIEAKTELKQYIKETETTFQDESEYNKEILAITAGVTKTEIASEEWKEENGVFVLYLTCNITVDTEDVNSKIQELVRDRQKLADVKMLQDEVARLQEGMKKLRKKLERAEASKVEEIKQQLEQAQASQVEEIKQQLEQAQDSQIEEIKQQRRRLSKDLSATEWYDKALATNDLDKKIEYYSYAIEQKLDWSSPYVTRGFVYFLKHDWDRAIADYNRAIQIDPNFAWAYNNRGFVYGSKGEYDRAISDFNRAIQIDPNFAVAYNNRGFVYGSKREYDRAIADFNKAIQIDPNDAKVYINRGIAYVSKGDCDRAIADWNRALEIDPNSAYVYFLQGRTYKHLGDKINARRSFQKAKELGDPDAQKELDELR